MQADNNHLEDQMVPHNHLEDQMVPHKATGEDQLDQQGPFPAEVLHIVVGYKLDIVEVEAFQLVEPAGPSFDSENTHREGVPWLA